MYRVAPFLPCAALAPILWCFGAIAGTSGAPVATVEEVTDGACMMRESISAQPHPLHKNDTLKATDQVQCEASLSAQCKYNETGGVFFLSGTWRPVGNPGPRPPPPDQPRAPAYTRPAFNLPPPEGNPNQTVFADVSKSFSPELDSDFKIGFYSKEQSKEGLMAKFAFEADAALARIHLLGSSTSKDGQEGLLVYPVDSKAPIALYQNPGDKRPYAVLPPGSPPLISNNKPTESGFWGVRVGGKDAWVSAKSVQVQSAGPVAKSENRLFGCRPGGNLGACE